MTSPLRSRGGRVLAALAPCLLAALPATAQRRSLSAPEAVREAPYRRLDNVEGDHVELLLTPVVPLAFGPDDELFAVNVHGSEVRVFDRSRRALERVLQVPWGPVSVAHWTSPVDDHDELLVVTRGTHGLTRLDPQTGTILGYLPLPSEPGGLLLRDDHLFVACSGEDVVVEIDLVSGSVFDRYPIRSARHVLFLSEAGDDVIVTPVVSGNDSMATRHPDLGPIGAGRVVDLADPGVAATDLPDADVFRLIPGDAPFTGRVEVAARGVGSLLFGHGINRRTGDLWVLGSELLNKDPQRQGEAALRGDIVRHRITVVDLPSRGEPPEEEDDHEFIELSLAKPYALYLTYRGKAFVVGTSSDEVHVIDRHGNRDGSWSLPRGSLPRAILVDEWRDLGYVYCWGTNQVRVYDVDDEDDVDFEGVLDLGYDPTPPPLQRGRALFFDARNSQDDDSSCETCHVEGGSDLLAWNLGDAVYDDKGPMLTQSLRGLEGTGPFHWRGEQTLRGFNRAFAALLGGRPLDTDDFDDLEAYMLSLREPANPFADPRRIVVDDPEATRFALPEGVREGVSAVRGQEVYFEAPSVRDASCQACHTLPSGTVNDFFPNGFHDRGARVSFDVPTLRALWRRERGDRATVRLHGELPEERGPLGSALSHAGTMPGIPEFVRDVFTFDPGTDQDLAFFLHQVDTGLAPAVHHALLLAPETPENVRRIWVELLGQARLRNCDVAVVGDVELPGLGTQRVRWYWDHASERFVPEAAALPTRRFSHFILQARAGTGRNLFVGLPVGMGRRWAVDSDGDDVLNLDEDGYGLDPHDPDEDDDGFLDGTELTHGSDPRSAASVPQETVPPKVLSLRVPWSTARVARLVVETDEPTALEVEYWAQGGTSEMARSAGPTRLHSLVLEDLEPSYDTLGIRRMHEGLARLTDEAGNTTEVELPPIESASFVSALDAILPVEAVVADLPPPDVSFVPGDGYRLTYRARVDHRKLRAPAPLSRQVVVARVIVNGEREDDFRIGDGAPALELRSALWPGGVYPGAGPFLVGTPSDGAGISTLELTLPNARDGDRVQIAIETIGWAFPPWDFDRSEPEFREVTVYDLPSTAPEHRVSPPVEL